MIFYFMTPLILIFSSSLGLIIDPSWSISPFIWVFVLVPIIDLVLPYLSKDDVELKENIFHNFSYIFSQSRKFFRQVMGDHFPTV